MYGGKSRLAALAICLAAWVGAPFTAGAQEDSGMVSMETARYTYEQMSQDIGELQAAYPDTLRVDTAGETADGRTIYVLSVGNPDAPHHIVIQAAIHGREYINSLIAMRQIEELLQAYPAGNCRGIAYEELLEQVCFHVLPMANPDGVAVSQYGTEAIRDTELKEILEACRRNDEAAAAPPETAAEEANGKVTDGQSEGEMAEGLTGGAPQENERSGQEAARADASAYWRSWKANARGVDLNRNFDSGWASFQGASVPSSERYKGESPASERETAAILEAVRQYDAECVISYHSSGNVVFWDYGSAGDVFGQDWALAKVVGWTTGYTLSSSVQSRLDAAGCSDYYVLEQEIPAVTIENGQGECPLGDEELQKVWQANRELLPELALYFSGLGSVPEQLSCVVVKCSESITLRTEPSTSASEICQIPLGSVVTLIGPEKNGFFRIAYNGQTGYSLAEYLKLQKPGEAAAQLTCVVANCRESITLRTADNTGAQEICQIPLGAQVQFLSAAGNGFYRIAYNGNEGYSLAEYLEFR